jgi:hypothetical protein
LHSSLSTTSLLFVNYKQRVYFHTSSTVFDCCGNITNILIPRSQRSCVILYTNRDFVVSVPCSSLWKLTTSKYRRSWWRKFQSSAINTAINAEHSVSKELKWNKLFCIWYAIFSAESKTRLKDYTEPVYCGVRTRQLIHVLYLLCKVKVNFTLEQAMKAQKGSRCIALLFFNLGARWWVVNATPRSLYPRERDPVPIVEGAGWAPGPVRTVAENLASHRDLIPGPFMCKTFLLTEWVGIKVTSRGSGKSNK